MLNSGKFYFGVFPARKPLILVILIVAEIISYNVIFIFLWSAVQKFHLGKFSPNNCLTNIFLHRVFQLSMSGS